MITFVFQDQIHLEKIRADLWCGREYGRAAVMVGAGFSRNAERLSSSIRPFPLLQDLAAIIYQALYPTRGHLTPTAQSKEQTTRVRATSGSGVLRLALEYQAEFGRPALDDLVLKALPDDDYLPGRLHRLLLSLPWSDVFTTNYDTLVERARAAVHERKYDLVQTIHDIPGRMKPRIVKLHGSFPSNRPFVITEDDYRTYPAQFAPFVNTVQQSIMENSFCLIGFSGDDPNFLYWSGWVRDNLKDATPTIYLCGLLDLSPAARKVLQSRRVIPIDLSPLFPVEEWPDADVRHSKALEWLILDLMSGAAPELKNWPEPSASPPVERSQGLPEIPPGPKALSGNGAQFPNPQGFKIEDLAALRKAWSLNRLEYPGWVVAPEENRRSVWRFTEYWIDTIFASIGDLSFPDNLLLLYELNWRLELTLTPLLLDQVRAITAILDQINSFPHLIQLEAAKFRPDGKDHAEVNWTEISKCWIELAFGLAREAREDLDEKRFRLWMDRLKPVIAHRSEFQARWFYEEALFSLFRLDQKTLLQNIRAWPLMPDLPFWESRRAALLAELGKTDEATRIAEAALTKIRGHFQPHKIDYALFSQEGFVMMLLRALGTAGHPFGETGERFLTRWDKLGAFGCDPWDEVRLFDLALKAPQPGAALSSPVKPGFDLDGWTIAHRTWPGVRFADYRPAFGLLRFYEDGGIPIRCGMTSMFSEAAATAAKWVLPFAPLWSLAIFLRTGDDKWIKDVYGRAQLATFGQEAVDSIFALCSDSLRQSLELIPGSAERVDARLAYRLIPALAELLSRLAFRLKESQRAAAFDLGLRLYSLGAARGDFSLLDHSPPLLQRSAASMTGTEVLERIPSLLSLPIVREQGFESFPVPEICPEPFDYFKLQPKPRVGVPTGVDWGLPISRLTRLAAKGSPPIVRRRAATRLAALHRLGWLTPAQQIDFAQALWSETDATINLPTNTDFCRFAFLSLPEVSPGEARRLVRSFFLQSEIPRVLSRTRLPDGREQLALNLAAVNNPYLRDLLGATKPLFPSSEEEARCIDWSPEESVRLLKKLTSWWEAEKSEIRPNRTGQLFDLQDELQSRLEDMVEVMAKVVLPRLQNADAAAKQEANSLLAEMEQRDFSILAAVPAGLFINLQSFEEAASKIRAGLISNNEREARKAMGSVSLWLAHSQAGPIPPPPRDLLDTLVNKVRTRSQPALVNALGQIREVVRQLPLVLHDTHIADLCVGLDYLLTETSLADVLALDERDTKRLTPTADLPLLRKYASALASQIYSWALAAGKPIPPAITKWKGAAQADVLPEVRSEWDFGTQPGP